MFIIQLLKQDQKSYIFSKEKILCHNILVLSHFLKVFPIYQINYSNYVKEVVLDVKNPSRSCIFYELPHVRKRWL